jgi:chemotaxis protein CheD
MMVKLAARIGGLLHYQLPCSPLNSENARRSPFMFDDTGIKELLERLIAAGGSVRRLQVKHAGTAQIISASDWFGVGR